MTSTVPISVGRELLELVLPTRCAACRTRGSVVCRGCTAALAAGRFALGARQVQPTPVPAGLPSTWAVAALVGTLRTLLTSYKDDARRDLAPCLGGLLAESVRAAVDSATPRQGDLQREVILVPVPASWRSRRSRGDRPLEGLAVAAALRLPEPVRVVRALRVTRHTRDQSGLDHHERARNVNGSMEAVTGPMADELRRHRVVIVDDILTTGSTLVEAARALSEVGVDARAAVVAATQRRPVVAPWFPD